MSLTADALEDRILAIEEAISDLQEALNALATKQQLKQLVLLRTQNQNALEIRIASLETQIALLQS